MKHYTLTLIWILVTVISTPCVNATGLSSVGAGFSEWGIYDGDRERTTHFFAEWREVDEFYRIKPSFLVFVDDGDNFYAAAGLAKYVNYTDKLSFGVGFSAGYLKHSDELGYDLEFYSRLIAKYKISPRYRLRFETGHISNAGFGNINPGSENVVISFEYAF